MKKTLFILLLTALVLLTGVACADVRFPADLNAIEDKAFAGDTSLYGRIELPDSILAVGSRAFAGTGIHALVIPEGCAVLETDLLADGQAVYVYLRGADTVMLNTWFTNVPFVFAPAGGSAVGMRGFYALETLAEVNGLYFSVTDSEAIPLCMVDVTDAKTITIPKYVNDQPVRSLDVLDLTGCVALETLLVPGYLTAPEYVNTAVYETMTVDSLTPSVTGIAAGNDVTWTANVTGGYGAMSYVWTFTTGSEVQSLRTEEPTVTLEMQSEGQCIVTLTVEDELGDQATFTGGSVTVGPMIPVYRALLVGNTYPTADKPLPGPDNDVAAMRTMLGSMSGTDYTITSMLNLNATGITNAITSTFANARSCDVSLFYYSGHGTNIGSLVGVGNSALSVNALRSILDTIPGTKIVIIDACYSGWIIGKSVNANSPSAFNSAVVSAFAARTKANLATDNYIVLTSCTSGQYSQSMTDNESLVSFGLFTYGLCYGSGYDEWNQVSLSNLPADANGDGAITLSEALNGALDRVAYIESLLPAAEAAEVDQTAQSYGDSDYILWSK